ncbi:MAG: capsular biosynthesis protein, partial [Gemmatimonadota bacterium]
MPVPIQHTLAALLLASLAACHSPAPTVTPRPAVTAAPDAAEQRLHNDWAWLSRYRDENAQLPAPAAGEQRVVFYGNSITDGWARLFPQQFPGLPYIGRGIGGQTTPQLLVRFQ